MKSALRFSVLAAFSVASLMAQAQRVGGLPGNGSPGFGNTPNQSSASGSDLGAPSANAAIFFSGKVVTDDGSPVPQNTAIQRICQNAPRTVAWTDGKGHFFFQWGTQNSAILPDASESGIGNGRLNGNMNSGIPNASRGLDPFAGCELRANATGFRSDSINLAGRRIFDNSDVGSIVLHRLANVEGTSVSATALNAPKDAQKAFQKGEDSLHKAKLDDAAKEFEKAVQLYPKYANAWLDLGRVQLQQQMTDPARASFKKAIEADDKLVDAFVELGLLASRASNWPDTAQYLDHALKLDPVDFPQAWFPDAIAAYNMKNYDVAERSAREALKADPDHKSPKEDQLMGLIFAQKGQYAEAAEELRTYLRLAPNAEDLDQVKAQLAQIDSLAKQPKQP